MIGIPQGTPLSCILFILYINDLPKVVKDACINLFADDTLVWIECEDIEEGMRMLNNDLERISKYLKSLKLKLNTLKTKYMIVGNSNVSGVSDVVIDGCTIEKVTTMKYLGVIIDDKLDFNANTEYVEKKLSKKISFLGRNRNKMNRDTKSLFYNTVISPHLDYCSSVLFLANESQIERLQKQQNKALRIILNKDRRTHIHSMLTELEMLDVKQRISFNVLVLMFKATRNLLPNYLCAHFIQVGETQPYLLRNNNEIRLPDYLPANAQNSFVYKGAKLYNDMMKNTEIQTLQQFQDKAKQYVKVNIKSHRIP